VIVQAIRDQIGPDAVENVASGNALRVLKSGFEVEGATIAPGERIPWAPLP